MTIRPLRSTFVRSVRHAFERRFLDDARPRAALLFGVTRLIVACLGIAAAATAASAQTCVSSADIVGVVCTLSTNASSIDLDTVLAAAQKVNPLVSANTAMVITAFGGKGGDGNSSGAEGGGESGLGGSAQLATTIADFQSNYNTTTIFYYIGSQGDTNHPGGKGGASTIVSIANLATTKPTTSNVLLVAGGGGGGSAAEPVHSGHSGGQGGVVTSTTSGPATQAGSRGAGGQDDNGGGAGHGGFGGDNGTGGAGGEGGSGTDSVSGTSGNDGLGGMGGAVHVSNGPSTSDGWINVSGGTLAAVGTSGQGGEGEVRCTSECGEGGGGGGGYGGGGGGGGGGDTFSGGGGGGGGSFAAKSTVVAAISPSNPGSDGSVLITFPTWANCTKTAGVVYCPLPTTRQSSVNLAELVSELASLGVTTTTPMWIQAWGGFGAKAVDQPISGQPDAPGGDGGFAQTVTTAAGLISAGYSTLYYYVGDFGKTTSESDASGGGPGGGAGTGGASTVVSLVDLTATDAVIDTTGSGTNVLVVAGGGGGGGEASGKAVSSSKASLGNPGAAGGFAIATTSGYASKAGNTTAATGSNPGQSGSGGGAGKGGSGASAGADGVGGQGGIGGVNACGGIPSPTNSGWVNASPTGLGDTGTTEFGEGDCGITEASGGQVISYQGGGGGGGGGWGGGGGGFSSDNETEFGGGGGGGGGGSYAAMAALNDPLSKCLPTSPFFGGSTGGVQLVFDLVARTAALFDISKTGTIAFKTKGGSTTVDISSGDLLGSLDTSQAQVLAVGCADVAVTDPSSSTAPPVIISGLTITATASGYTLAGTISIYGPPTGTIRGTLSLTGTGSLTSSVSFSGSATDLSPSTVESLTISNLTITPATTTEVSSGKVQNIGSNKDNGIVELTGSFTPSRPVRLDRASLTLTSLLYEFPGAGEITRAAGGASELPLVLTAKTGAKSDKATYATAAGARPSVSVDVKVRDAKKNLVEYKVKVDRASLTTAPAGCLGGGRAAVDLRARFALDDGLGRPVVVKGTLPWQCRGNNLKTP